MSNPVCRMGLLLLAAVPIVFSTTPAGAEVVARQGQSWLENVNGLLVLHLRGTPSEMGYAHGYLLADKVVKVYQGLNSVLNREMSKRADQTRIAAAAQPFIPQRYIDEINGIALGANAALQRTPAPIDAARLLEMHSWDEIVQDQERSRVAHFAVLGGATKNNHVILGLNRDDEQAIRKGVQDGAVAIIYEPDEGHTFSTIGWAGFAGVVAGMNSQGLAISGAPFPSYGEGVYGLPFCFQLRKVMEQAADPSAAENVLRSAERTVTGNILVAYGEGGGVVRAFEFTTDRFEVFRDGDPREDHSYTIRDGGVPVRVIYFDPPIDISLPSGQGNLNVVAAKSLSNAIVRSHVFVHHEGQAGSATPPLLELQCNWVMNLSVTNPDFDFIDVTPSLPAAYPYRSLDVALLIDKIVSKHARDILPPAMVAGVDLLIPNWDAQLYQPAYAAFTRQALLRQRVESQAGQIDASAAIAILGGGQPREAFNPLTEPNTLHSAVFDATTMQLWVASAPPRGQKGEVDANLQAYRHLDFAAYATYPMTAATTPVAGEVFVDGVSWGTAPQTRRVMPGQHAVSFGAVADYRPPSDQTANVSRSGANVTGTYVATHQLTIHVDGQGTTEPNSGVYDEGTKVTLTAKPSPGHRFVEWTGDATGTSPIVEVVLSRDIDVTAHFAAIPLDSRALTIVKEGEGTVQPDDGVYPVGSEITLTATPADGWVFLGWTGDVYSSEPSVRLLMDGNKTVRAIFQKQAGRYYQLIATVDGQGAVEPLSGLYQEGTTLTLAATPAPSQHFTGWSGDASGTDPTLTVTLARDTAITAHFAPNPEGQHTLTIIREGQGSVDPASGLYGDGAELTLTATPSEDWVFAGWKGDVEFADPTLRLTMDYDKTIRAVFQKIVTLKYQLTVHTDGQGGVEPNRGTYDEGTELTINATPSPGYYFMMWSGDVIGANPTAVITMTRDTSITAHFAPHPQGQSSLTVHTQGKGTVEPSHGLYVTGTEATLTATPAGGWFFVRWTGDVTSTEETVRVVLDRDKSVTAVFQEGVKLTVEIQGPGQVTLDPPGGLYRPGTPVNLSAQVLQEIDAAWQFTAWKGDLESTANPVTVAMDSNKHIVAVFMLESPGNDHEPLFPCLAAPGAALAAMMLAGGVLIGSRGHRSCDSGRRR